MKRPYRDSQIGVLFMLGAACVITAAPADSSHVRDVLLAKMSAYEEKADNLYKVTNGSIRVGIHALEVTPVVEADTAVSGKSVFAMRLELVVDGKTQPAATFGAIGIGPDKEEAIAIGLGEWYMGFGMPYFQALAGKAPSDTLGGYDIYPGAMGLRGGAAAGWMNDSDAMHRKLLAVALPLASSKADLLILDLKVAVSAKGTANSECRVDAVVAPKLNAALAALDWPTTPDGYIFKQAYVLKRRGPRKVENR